MKNPFVSNRSLPRNILSGQEILYQCSEMEKEQNWVCFHTTTTGKNLNVLNETFLVYLLSPSCLFNWLTFWEK